MQICLAGSDYIHFPDVSCLCINDCTTSFYITMIHLLLSTLAMMGLTFLIGFFVAAVIKLIAYAADSFDFYLSVCIGRFRCIYIDKQIVDKSILRIIESSNLSSKINNPISPAIYILIYF